MNRATLTALYLDEVKRRGAPASELVGRQAESAQLNAYYQGRYLPPAAVPGQRPNGTSCTPTWPTCARRWSACPTGSTAGIWPPSPARSG